MGKITVNNEPQLRDAIQKFSVHRGTEFTLTSGKRSNLYFDMKATTMDATGGHLAATSLLTLIEDWPHDYLTGVATGAVPLVARMIEIDYLVRPRTGLISRGGVKSHGMGRQIEGVREHANLSGKASVVIEDVTTTGGSISAAVTALRELGAIVTYAACLVRRSEDAERRLQTEGVTLRYIFTEADFS